MSPRPEDEKPGDALKASDHLRRKAGPLDAFAAGRRGGGLLQVQLEDWLDPKTTENSREEYIKRLYGEYNKRVEEFVETANQCAERHTKFLTSHKRWRWLIIIFTGVMAIINLTAAYVGAQSSVDGQAAYVICPGQVWSLFAAILAAILAMLANLENFSNAVERAQAYREARDMFLDAGREHHILWQLYVTPYYPAAEACVNAAELSRLINNKDAELRDKLKEITQQKDK
jgi:hypothetical protein